MKGRYGIHGGQYVPETLMNEIHKIEEAYEFYKNDQAFNDELNTLLKEYAGRPSLLYYAKKMTKDLASIVEVVRENTDVPCAIGFGISNPEQAKKMAEISDGAIVGSAIIKILEKYGKEAPKYVGEYVKSMKDAIRGL